MVHLHQKKIRFHLGLEIEIENEMYSSEITLKTDKTDLV